MSVRDRYYKKKKNENSGVLTKYNDQDETFSRRAQ